MDTNRVSSTLSPEEQRRRRRHRNERIVAATLVILLAAATYAFLRWSRADEEAFRRNRLYIPRQQAITPEILLLQEFVRIDTSTPAGGAAGARWLADQLRQRGVEPELIESGPDRLNVYARIRGRQPDGALLLFNHIDVVPAGSEGWDRPPFEGTIHSNRLWGRGTLDMKALAISQLLAFAAVANDSQPPQHDLIFLATAEEEQGSAEGMQWLLEHRPDLFAGVAAGITEGGITEMFAERMTYFGIEVGGKQRAVVRIAAPDLETAQKVRIALEPWINPREPDGIPPGIRTYLEQIAPTRASFGPLLANLDETVATGAFWRLPDTYRSLMQNNLWMEAPVESDDGATLLVFLLNLPDEDPEERVRWLEQEIASFGVSIERLESQGPVPLSPSDTPLFELLRAEAARRYQTTAGTQILYRSTSDCRFLRVRGIACYGVSPYPVDIHESTSIHGTNERITLDRFMEGVDYLEAVVTTWARGE